MVKTPLPLPMLSRMQGYDVSKTAKEVSCCALGARNQTAIIERLDEAKWNEAFPSTTAATTSSGRVNSSAKQQQQRRQGGGGSDDAPMPIGIGKEEEAKGGGAAAATSFKGVLIGQVLASSVSALPQQQLTGEMDAVVTTEQPAVVVESEEEVAAAAEVAVVTNDNSSPPQQQQQQQPKETEAKDATTAGAAGAGGDVDNQNAAEVPPEDLASIALKEVERADREKEEAAKKEAAQNNEIAELKRQLEEKDKMVKAKEEALKQKDEEVKQQKALAQKKQQENLKSRLEDLRNKMKTNVTSLPVSVKASAAIVDGKMDIDTSSEIVSALEKVSEGYIAASESKKQLTQQLKDMSSAMGVTTAPIGGEEEDGVQASGSVLMKRKQQDDVQGTTTGLVNASAGAAATSPSLPQHTVDFLAGKISYDQLNEQCERQRVLEARVGVQQLRGSVMASSAAAATGTGGSAVPSHAMAYSQYCAGKSLLPPVDQLRQDCRGAGLKQVFPGVWNEFLSIANSFDKTGVPPYVKQNILRGLNTYEHKRRNGESRLELNDTMPPPPGGNVRDRAARELVAKRQRPIN